MVACGQSFTVEEFRKGVPEKRRFVVAVFDNPLHWIPESQVASLMTVSRGAESLIPLSSRISPLQQKRSLLPRGGCLWGSHCDLRRLKCLGRSAVLHHARLCLQGVFKICPMCPDNSTSLALQQSLLAITGPCSRPSPFLPHIVTGLTGLEKVLDLEPKSRTIPADLLLGGPSDWHASEIRPLHRTPRDHSDHRKRVNHGPVLPRPLQRSVR